MYWTEEVYAPTSAGFCINCFTVDSESVLSCTDRFTVDSESLLSCGPCLPGDIQLVLGGQHMRAIVKELWLALTSPIEQGGQAVAESDVPREMRFVYGVILREDTPLEICRLAAVLHQRAQREFCETTFSEVAAAFLQRCAEIVKRTGQKYATPDAGEIWEVVRDVGVPYKEYMDIDKTVCDKRICT